MDLNLKINFENLFYNFYLQIILNENKKKLIFKFE